MNQQEFLYSYNSILITVTLFLLILLVNELGFQFGRYLQKQTDSEIKALTGSIQGSVLGLLALLLGFTFSMSMQRYDNRNQALIDEANAIGTAQLRIQLLPEQYINPANELLQEYIELRVKMGQIDLTQYETRRNFNNDISRLQQDIWDLAILAVDDDPRPVTTGAFIASLNEMIDRQGKRNALQQMHVPEVVLFLLFLVFISSGGILGYSSGLSGTRVIAPTALVSFLIAMVVFIIIDLDRPKRGLIQVNQNILQELQTK